MGSANTPARLVLLILVSAAITAGCRDNTPASDVRGNYQLSFDDRITIKLDIAGAKQSSEGSESGTVTFQINGNPVVLDLAAFCAKEEVKCPSEVLWTEVAVDQPNIAAANPNTHVLNVIDNRVHAPPAGVAAEVIGGLIGADDRFTLLVGGQTRGNGDCGLLALSVAEGRFSHEGESVVDEPAAPAFVDGGTAIDGGVLDGGTALDAGFVSRLTIPPGSPVDGIKDGRLRVGFLGVCAFGPALLGATLELSTGFSGTRTGPFDPPPFTPVDPESVPDGIVDAGPVADAG
ncbi:MAG: hypothetical protein IT383_20490 [Deltaproteobacteria bacterium]|nr:hypothetical protein [Deltaproteobacteria bacterium]